MRQHKDTEQATRARSHRQRQGRRAGLILVVTNRFSSAHSPLLSLLPCPSLSFLQPPQRRHLHSHGEPARSVAQAATGRNRVGGCNHCQEVKQAASSAASCVCVHAHAQHAPCERVAVSFASIVPLFASLKLFTRSKFSIFKHSLRFF